MGDHLDLPSHNREQAERATAVQWREVALGDVCTKIGSGATPRGGKEAYVQDGSYALVRSQNVHNAGFSRDGLAFITDEQAQALQNVEVFPGDVLLNITGDSVARVCHVDPAVLPARVNQHVAIIRTDPRKLDARYLRYYLVAPQVQSMLLSWAGSGGTRNALTKRMIESFEVRAPAAVAEQRDIAHILGTLDDKIELNRRMNQTLEEMARALFKSWFVDFDPVRAKAALKQHALRHHDTLDVEPIYNGDAPAGEWTIERARAYLSNMDSEIADLFPDRLTESALGEIPEGWAVTALGELAQVIKGRSYRSADLGDSNVALVTLKSIKRGGGYSPDGLKSYTGRYHSRQVVKAGDVIVAQTDVTQAAEVIGRAAVVCNSPDYNTLVVSLDLLVIRPDPPLMTAYVYRMLQGHAFLHHALARVNGTTVLHMERDAVPEFEFPLPPRLVIDRFTRAMLSLHSVSDNNIRGSDNLIRQRDVLLPKLIAGEVRMTDPS